MPAAIPQPHSQEDILDAALASLTAADVPPDDDARAVPDPDCGRPAELAGLTTAELDALIATVPDLVAEPGPGGPVAREGCGAGFAEDGVLDVLAPGMALAGFADAAQARLGQLSDNELVGVLRGWRRLTSWAQARELAAVAELARRRPSHHARATPPGQPLLNWSEFLAAEVAMALTLTRAGGETEVALATGLDCRPATAAALATGRIDLAKARVILDGVSTLTDTHAAMVESAVLPIAPGLTPGELRAEVAYLVLAADPAAARTQRERDEAQARVECWVNPTGTASLAGRNLPSAQALAADKRLCRVAAVWKKQIRAAWKHADPAGQQPRPEAGTDLLRARAYLALLLGLPVDTPPTCSPQPTPPAPATRTARTAAAPARTAATRSVSPRAAPSPVPVRPARPARTTSTSRPDSAAAAPPHRRSRRRWRARSTSPCH